MAIEFHLPPKHALGNVKPKKTHVLTKAAILGRLASKSTKIGITVPCTVNSAHLALALFFDCDNGYSPAFCFQFAQSCFWQAPDLYLYVNARVKWLRKEKLRVISELASCGFVMAAARAAGNMGFVAAAADLNHFFSSWGFQIWRKRWAKESGPDYVFCVDPAHSAFVEVKGRHGVSEPLPRSKAKFAQEKVQSMNARFHPRFKSAVLYALCYCNYKPSARVSVQSFNHRFESPDLGVSVAPYVAFCQFVRQLLNAGHTPLAMLLLNANSRELEFRERLEQRFLRSDEVWLERHAVAIQFAISESTLRVFWAMREHFRNEASLGDPEQLLRLVESIESIPEMDGFTVIGRSPVGTALLRPTQGAR